MSTPTPSWKKPAVRQLLPEAFVTRAWVIDLDTHYAETGIEITPRDLFDASLWSNIRSRKPFDRGDNLTSLKEGEICRCVRTEGPAPFDVDLVCVAALPGGLVMRLRGARTPWDQLQEIEAKALNQRRAAVKVAAAAASGELA
jgi:hypothetical protein